MASLGANGVAMTQQETERKIDRAGARGAADVETPSVAYARCEHQVTRLLKGHVPEQAALQQLVKGVMEHAQEYAVTMARLYLQSRGHTDLPSADSILHRENDGRRETP